MAVRLGHDFLRLSLVSGMGVYLPLPSDRPLVAS